VPGWTWDAVADKWEEGFARLVDYVEQNRHARVPQSYRVDGFKLGGWVTLQRQTYREGKLEADRQRRLEEVPGWTWDAVADKWEEGFARLVDYVEQNRHARVPKSYTVDGYNLGQWVANQRGFHDRGTLDADRERRLKELSGWTWDTVADKWEESFDQLVDYVRRHGHARIPQSYKVNSYDLGGWADSQRRHRTKGTLDADRERRLHALPGWAWEPQVARWEENFDRLLDYVERHGHARVPQSYRDEGYQLGVWVAAQRQLFGDGLLASDRRRRLQELSGWTWNTLIDKWEEGFRRVVDYVELHGHARVPSSYTVGGYKVGGWVLQQRQSHSKGTLDADRERRLQALPGWTWDPHADKWEEGFRKLSDYIECHGHARVPSTYSVNGFRLWPWVHNQRGRHTRGTLEPDREYRLEQLPGWTWKAPSSS
jgi:hypothetical protein